MCLVPLACSPHMGNTCRRGAVWGSLVAALSIKSLWRGVQSLGSCAVVPQPTRWRVCQQGPGTSPKLKNDP